jgi:hypothetical protein
MTDPSPYTQLCVTEKYFEKRGFKREAPGVYSKQEYQFINMNGQREALERTSRFKVYSVDPDHGTNIEWYINTILQLSGYWTTTVDFQRTFKI